MELIVHNECKDHRRRNGIEFRCSLCDHIIHVDYYNKQSIGETRTLIIGHLLYDHNQREIIIHMINDMFEKIGEYEID